MIGGFMKRRNQHGILYEVERQPFGNTADVLIYDGYGYYPARCQGFNTLMLAEAFAELITQEHVDNFSYPKAVECC